MQKLNAPPYGKIRPFQPKNRSVLRCSTGGCALPKRPEMPCFQAFSGGCICIYVRAALMAVFHVVLGHFALVFLELLCQIIGTEALLQPGVALIALVRQNAQYGAFAPDVPAPGRRYPGLGQLPCNLPGRKPFEAVTVR